MIACVFGPLVKVSKRQHDEQVKENALAVAIMFFLNKEANYAGTIYKKWSILRRVIRLVHCVHCKICEFRRCVAAYGE